MGLLLLWLLLLSHVLVDVWKRWASFGVQVVVVYIREAHARNVWPIGDSVSRTVDAPRTDGERCALARRMREERDMDLPFLVDHIDNSFEAHFASWPFRFYILDGQARLQYKSQPSNDLTHCPVELETAIEN